MHKFTHFILGVILAGILAGGCRVEQPAPAAPPTITPLSNAAATPQPQVFPIQVAWFYGPPAEDDDYDVLRANFDFFILTHNDEALRDRLRSDGISGPFLQYLRIDAIQDPGDCGKRPWQNQAATQIGDFCQISAEHPDWFLLDIGGQRITHNGYHMMDPGNSEWRAFWLTRAAQSQEQYGWDGLFLDNVEASLSKRVRRGQLPARYLSDSSYQQAIEGFIAFIRKTYTNPQNRPLYANIVALQDQDIWFRYLAHLDGVMDESWAVDWDDGLLSPKVWLTDLERAEQTQALGRQIILVTQGYQGDIERQQFALASFLLVTQGRAVFRYAN
ncbi:MAG: putative glycoside hydrolase, partial [Anaerolineales bacterium]